jgi:hypothetical protein
MASTSRTVILQLERSKLNLSSRARGSGLDDLHLPRGRPVNDENIRERITRRHEGCDRNAGSGHGIGRSIRCPAVGAGRCFSHAI